MSFPCIIKLGGSLLSTGEKEIFRFEYLSELKKILIAPDMSDRQFFLAIGGGYTMRKYRDLAMAAGVQNVEEIHWIGTTVNVLHAYLVKAYLHDIADDEVIKYEDYYTDRPFQINKKIKVGGGGRPGHSGDVDAILAARKFGSDTVISLKNVDAVYERDPKIDPNAKKISRLTWKEYREIISGSTSHEPGGNYPIDPVAAQMAMEYKMKFIILAGENLPNFAAFLKGEEYNGSEVTG